jgi:hypothetical protein
MKAKLFAICKKTGGVATDTLSDGKTSLPTDVFYVSKKASNLSAHARSDKGERVRLLAPSMQKRAWALKLKGSGKLLEMSTGVVLAAGKKKTAKFLASICKIPATPVLLG